MRPRKGSVWAYVHTWAGPWYGGNLSRSIVYNYYYGGHTQAAPGKLSTTNLVLSLIPDWDPVSVMFFLICFYRTIALSVTQAAWDSCHHCSNVFLCTVQLHLHCSNWSLFFVQFLIFPFLSSLSLGELNFT